MLSLTLPTSRLADTALALLAHTYVLLKLLLFVFLMCVDGWSCFRFFHIVVSLTPTVTVAHHLYVITYMGGLLYDITCMCGLLYDILRCHLML